MALTIDSDIVNEIRYGFITENSKDISHDLVVYSVNVVNRGFYFTKLANLLLDVEMADDIEKSIFEFTLIHLTLNNMEKYLVDSIYEDKFTEIYLNLDESSRLDNRTFKSSILKGYINPKLVAFLSPEQIHPDNYSKIMDKINYREKTENNMVTTNSYKCYKCGERKIKVTEMQLRSADEPVNRFYTCLICYNTFIK